MNQTFREHKFLFFWFGAYALVLLGAIALLVLYRIERRRSDLDLGEVVIQNESRQLAHYLGSRLRIIDLSLLATAETERIVRGIEQGDRQALAGLLRRKLLVLPDVTGLQLVDAAGKELFHWGSGGALMDNPAQRDFFQRHRDALVPFQVFAQARDASGPRLYMTRRVEDGRGRFLGVLAACVSTRDMLDRYWELSSQSPDVVVLYDDSHHVLASWIGPKSGFDSAAKPFAGGELHASGGVGFEIEGGSHVARTDEAVLAATQLAGLPFHVAVAASSSRLLASWRANTIRSAVLLAAVALSLTLGLVYAARQFVKRSVLESELRLTKLRETFYTAIFTGNPCMQLLVEPKTGRIMKANPSARAFYGFRDDRDADIRWPDFDVSEPDKMEAFLDRDAQAGSSYHQFRHKVADGRVRDVEVYAGGIELVGGAFIHAIINDITPRIEAEAALVEATARAKAASKAKSEFLANMSHEIRTPMNGALGMLQLLKATTLDTDQKEYLGLCVLALDSLGDLINDILDFSKIEAGKLDIVEGLVSISALCEAVPKIFKSQIYSRKISCVIDVAPDVPETVLADGGRIRQILFNLVGNSLKFTKHGEIRITAALEGDGPTPSRKRLRFSVSDTGLGIPEDRLAILFEPFTQVDGSLTRAHQGTGLGLSIVKRLVELMNGRVEIQSALGRGTTVAFAIEVGLPGPREVKQRAGLLTPPEPGPRPAPRAARPAKVLLVEDDAINRSVILNLLKQLGHEASWAGNGSEALSLLARERFDCVFMDVQMPVMDGMETTRRIRTGANSSLDPDVPIVAVTAHAMRGDRERFLQAGMDDYVSKPVPLDELAAILEKLLARRAKAGQAG